MSLKLQIGATTPVITRDQAKVHFHEDLVDAGNDALIDGLIASATLDAEHLMGRAVMPQKWQLTLDDFTPLIQLNRPPVVAVDSVKYVDAITGVLTTLPASAYQLANASDYVARLVPAYGKSWPNVRQQLEAVQIIFSCGYENEAAVPAPIKTWIAMRAAALYKNRESESDQKTYSLGFVDFMLDPYRVWRL